MPKAFFSPVRVSIFFNQVDLSMMKAFDTHLAPLRDQGRITTWDVRQIPVGQPRQEEIEQHLETDALLILLLSADFLAAEEFYHLTQSALCRQREGTARVLPVLLRPCGWQETPLNMLQILPRNNEALTLSPNQDLIWHEIEREIRLLLDTLQQRLYLIAAPEDRVMAERFSREMAHSGVDLWRLEGDYLPSHLDEAREAMRQASSVVLIASPAVFSSRSVKAQMELATDYQRPIQMLWINDEEEVWSPPSAWQVEVVLDARAEHYEVAQETLVKKLKHPTITDPVASNLLQPSREPRNPYKGLHSFKEDDVCDFFGRDALIDALLIEWNTLLAQEQHGQRFERVLAVVGASGSGKSSVVRAGLLPRLRQEHQELIIFDPFTPGTHPLEALAVSLAQQPSLGDVVSLHEKLGADSLRTLHLLMRHFVGSSSCKVVLFIDQFEEVFTLTSSEEERAHFLDLLVTAITEPYGPLLVILTLRADFYDRPIQYPTLCRLLDAHHIMVLPMERDDLRQVIEGPAHLPDVQLTFENDLVGDLLFDMHEQVGALPLLEFTLEQLFLHRQEYTLTQHAYHELGKVKGALARHAEATYTALPTLAHQALARTLFLRLIELGRTEQNTTRRRVSLIELELPDLAQTTILRETTDAFVIARLLTTDEHVGVATVEVSHEALIQEWKRLAMWLDETREDIPLQQKISEDATQWQKHHQPNDRLYRGAQLKEARAWENRNTPSLTEVAFLRAGMKQQARTFVNLTMIVLLLLSTASGAIVSYIHAQQAQKAQQQAQAQIHDPTLVTTSQDNVVGSLRWAMSTAPSGSTITFDPRLQKQTIVLTGDLHIPAQKRLNLQGFMKGSFIISLPSHMIVVDMGASLALFNLHLLGGHSNPESVLNNLGVLSLINSTISGNSVSNLNGNSISPSYGGGITNSGTLSLTNSTISGNSTSLSYGGGITNSGTLSLTNSTISGNTDQEGGGGIDNSGTLSLTNSTISGNTALFGGGGIANSGRLFLANSTISDNTASFSGGGIDNYQGGTVSLAFCTLYGNKAPSGGGLATDDDTSVSSTIPSHTTLQNSLVAGNHALSKPDVAGELTSKGYNLIQQASGVKLQLTDRTGDPKLDPLLQSNGGPTQTHSLLPKSLAIDDIPLADCLIKFNGVLITTDQRGIKRPQGLTCDIGAYEYMP